jgi:hypothetical protein
VTRPSQGALPEWRFLQLTLFICGWMLLSPRMHDRWLVQLLLQVFLLNTVLITLWANPQWRHVRSALIGLWLVSLAGSLLALVPQAGESPRLLARSVEIASLIPLCAT